MKQVKDLKPGDIIYDLDFKQVKWYSYVCVHPHNKNYHIFVDEFEEPVRIYEPKLQDILNQGFKSYKDALLVLADRMEEQARKIKIDLAMEGK